MVKQIISGWGTVFLHAAADDVAPPDGVTHQDLINFVSEAYGFVTKPTLPRGLNPQNLQIFHFANGKLVKDEKSFVIQQLVVYQTGDAITANSTEAADIVMTDYIGRLDSGLGYRYVQKDWKRSYVSGIVVQFDVSLEEKISGLGVVGEILDRAIPRENKPFKPKTLSFGFGDPLTPQALNSVEAANVADVTFQRRAGEPYSENRYFCSAPLSTRDHLRMLEEIERAIST